MTINEENDGLFEGKKMFIYFYVCKIYYVIFIRSLKRRRRKKKYKK